MSDSKRLDWEGARDRLERVRASLEQAGTLSEERTREILEQRAARLAQAAATGESLAAEMLVIFSLAGERYAFPVSEVTEILPEFHLTPVPGAPSAVAGVIQVRGEIWPVYRLEKRLGLTAADSSPHGVVLLMQTPDRRFAMWADGVEEIRALKPDSRKAAGNDDHVAWMTEDFVRVLNSAALWTREV